MTVAEMEFMAREVIARYTLRPTSEVVVPPWALVLIEAAYCIGREDVCEQLEALDVPF